MEDLTCLELPTSPSTHPIPYNILSNSIVVLKKVAQNPAVLASYVAEIVLKR